MNKNYLDNVMEVVLSTPLWVQEIVYFELEKYIKEKVGNKQLVLNEWDVYPAYVPELTFKGKRELETHEHNLDLNVYKCFQSIIEGKRVIDITLNNFWTLEQTSDYLAFGIENEYIQTPQNMTIYAAILYIGSKIRLGEYIKRLEKIDTVQLDDVLRKQKSVNQGHPDERKKIGEIFVEMGFIVNNDIDAILAIKQDSQRRCFVNNNSNLSSQDDQKYEELLSKVNKLTQENNLLKEKLRAIFNLQNKNK